MYAWLKNVVNQINLLLGFWFLVVQDLDDLIYVLKQFENFI